MAHPQTPPTFNAVTTGSDEYSVELNDANIGTLACIVGMATNGSEDDNLVNFPNFSYATTLKYFTVNGDNSISNDTVESKPNDFNSRRGFYRAFYEDFKEGTSCNVILNDVSIKTNFLVRLFLSDNS